MATREELIAKYSSGNKTQKQTAPSTTDRGSSYSVPVKSALGKYVEQSGFAIEGIGDTVDIQPDKIPTESGIVNPNILNTEAGKKYVPVISSITPKDVVDMRTEFDRPSGFVDNLTAGRFGSNTAKVAQAYNRGSEMYQNIEKMSGRLDPKGLADEIGAETGAFLADVPVMALGTVIGGLGGALTLPRVVGKFADIKMRVEDSGRKISLKDTDSIAREILPEIVKGQAMAGVLGIVGKTSGYLAGKAVEKMGNTVGGIVEKAGAGAFNTAVKSSAEKPIKIATEAVLSTPAMVEASHLMDGTPRDAKEYYKSFITDLGFMGFRAMTEGKPEKLQPKDQVDVMENMYNKYKNTDNREILRVKVRDMLKQGKSVGDIIYSIDRVEMESGQPLLRDDTKAELYNILKQEEEYVSKDDSDKFERQPFESDLYTVRDQFDKDNSKYIDKVGDSGSIKNFFQAQDFKIRDTENRRKLIKKYLDDPKSDLAVLVEFNNTLAGVKESIDQHNTSKELYREVDDVNQSAVNRFMEVTPEMSENMWREMAITANKMPDSGWIKAIHGYNAGLGSVSRVIYRHLGPKVYEYIYQPLRTAVSHAELRNKRFSDTLEEMGKKLSDMEQMEVSRYFVERQVTADGKSAISGKDLDFKGAEKKEYADLNENQKEVVDFLEKYTEDTLNNINLSRKLLGKKPIEGLKGYAPLIAKDMGQYKKNFMMETDIADFLKNGEKDAKYLKERIGSDIPVIENVFESFPKYDRYMNQKIFITPVTSKVIDFADTLSRHQKHAGEYIRSMALDTEGSMIDGSQWQDGIRKIAGASSIGKLAWNITSVMAQTLAVIPAVVNLGPKPLLRASYKLLSDNDNRQRNREISPVLQASTADMSVQLAENTFDNKAMKWFVEKGMTPLKIIDRGVRQVVWEASYTRAKEMGQSEIQARSTADRETVSTQGSAERMDRAPLFRGSTGKLFAAIQSFKINEFHYMISDVMGVDRPNEFIKYFPKAEAESAKEFADRNGWDLHQLDNGTYTVYKKEGLSQFMRASRDFGILIAGMSLANMAFGMLEAETGLPINNPYPSPLDAWYKSKYGVTFEEYLAGASIKDSNLTERDRNIRAGTSALIEMTSIIPFLRSPEGAIVGTIVRGGDKIGRGLANQNYGQVAMGAVELSGLAGNPISAPISKADKYYRDGKEQAKAYLARERKGTLTQKEIDYNDSAVKQYFINVIKSQREDDKLYREQVKQERGGNSSGLKPMRGFGEMKSMKKFGE